MKRQTRRSLVATDHDRSVYFLRDISGTTRKKRRRATTDELCYELILEADLSVDSNRIKGRILSAS